MTKAIDCAASLSCKLSLISREITAAVARLLTPFGVTPGQAHVFYFLLQGETSPSVIARNIGIDASSLSRVLRTLEQRGHVERAIDLENRTRINLRLTPQGERLAHLIDPHAAQIQRRIEKALSPSELAALQEAIAAISAAMAPEGDEPLDLPAELADAVP